MSQPVNKWVVAVSIAIGSLMAAIDTSIVNVAMPQIRGELGASLQEITLITTATAESFCAASALNRCAPP